jgi:hypothetical protein
VEKVKKVEEVEEVEVAKFSSREVEPASFTKRTSST